MHLIKIIPIVLLTILCVACDNEQANTNAPEPQLRPVRYITVEPVKSGSMRTYSGLSKSGQESNLSFRVGGSIESLAVEVGDRLEAGEMIAEIDDSIYQLEAQQASANLSQAQSTLRNAQANFDRVKGLYENNNASRNDLDAARATAESSNAQVRAARKALELARLNIAYTKLKATEKCDVAEVLTEMNENITAGQTVVAVTCGERLEVELAVPESVIGLIQRGMDAFVNFSAIPDTQYNATVTEVGVASTAGATYPVTVALTEKPDGLRSGLAAQVSFPLDVNDDVASIIIPAVAVGEDVDGRYVFLAQSNTDTGTAQVQRQAVEIGELTPEGLEIVDGLKAGDKVITAGVNVIRDGLQVLID